MKTKTIFTHKISFKKIMKMKTSMTNRKATDKKAKKVPKMLVSI